MTFTDDDLKRLKYLISDGPQPYYWFSVVTNKGAEKINVNALLARLEASEEITKATEMAHPGDENCGCSMCDCIQAWRKAAGK